MTIILSSQPFYDRYVQRLTADDPISRKLYKNGKLWPFYKDALEPLMVVLYISPPLLLSKISIRIKKTELSLHMQF